MDRSIMLRRIYGHIESIENKFDILTEKLGILEEMPQANKSRDAELDKLFQLERFDKMLDLIVESVGKVISENKKVSVVKRGRKQKED